MVLVTEHIERFHTVFPDLSDVPPWNISVNASRIILEKISNLGDDFKVFNNIAIHRSVVIDSHAIIKGPAIISGNSFVGSHAIIRGGVFVDQNVTIGPACEVKSSFIFANSALGHFNFVGDSILGSQVNLEAGAVIANHYNERAEKMIFVVINGKAFPTGLEKFGAMVGDNCKIGANAVLSPGTILSKGAIVARLELIEQYKQRE